MSLPIIGNTTFSSPTPGVQVYTFPHTQTAGSNRGLLISLAEGNGVSVTGVKYNGVSMIQLQNVLVSSISQYLSSWWLPNPAEGSNTVEITFSAILWTPVSIATYSFTGSGGVGDSDTDAPGGNPSNITLTCQNDSLIFARGQSSATAGSITIDGIIYSYPNDLDIPSHNTNSQAWAKLGTNGVASGNRVASCDASSGVAFSQAVEILGVSASAPTVTATDDATNITPDDFDSGGNVSSDGGSALTEVGICYQNTPNPTTSDWKAVVGTPAVGTFSLTVSNYSSVTNPGDTIYYRAYAINGIGTSYGPEKSFVAPIADEAYQYLHDVGRGVRAGIGSGIC